mmetsp:Transcript_27954/g.32232  ORF Transcript_27954/g.32232 Transcript_27954/m.32232 type:complete len:145 (-) Transcript_27954:509-943(-)
MRHRLIQKFQPTGVEALFDILLKFFSFEQSSTESTAGFSSCMCILATHSKTAGQVVTPTLQVIATLLRLDSQQFGDMHATFDNGMPDYSKDNLPSFMTKFENFEQHKSILTSSSPSTISAQTARTQATTPTPQDTPFTWFGKHD